MNKVHHVKPMQLVTRLPEIGDRVVIAPPDEPCQVSDWSPAILWGSSGTVTQIRIWKREDQVRWKYFVLFEQPIKKISGVWLRKGEAIR